MSTDTDKTPIDPTLIPENAVIVIFGATGDLARRKLLPALFHLAVAGLLPDRYRIIGAAPARPGRDHAGFVDFVHESLEKFGREALSDDTWTVFRDSLAFAAIANDDLTALTEVVATAEAELGSVHRIFYLAVPAPAFNPVISALGASELVTEETKIVIEKPFGSDFATACKLNAALHDVFDESQIYRIDHFLGKEAVQNILALRFANGFIEPAWCAEHLDYVQIDVPEQLTIEGRGSFYEATGAFRDMVVTHLFQMLGFLAMEAPTTFDAASLHSAKLRAFQDLQVLDPQRAVFGQYEGYRSEPGVAADSQVETFAAIEARIDNERWKGVSFYLRTGKAMAVTCTTVTLGFKKAALELFHMDTGASDDIRPNELVLELSDPGGLAVSFLAKLPGPRMLLEPAVLSRNYVDSFNSANHLEAYGRLLHDVMLGDLTLFNHADGIERLWEVAAPLLTTPPNVVPYAKNTWGPHQADDLVAPHRWHLPAPTLQESSLALTHVQEES